MKPQPQVPKVNVSIPKDSLGLPGKSYQLYAQGAKKGEPRQSPSHVLQDSYHVLLTLTRATSEDHNITFSPVGDSYVQFAKPQAERAATDYDELDIDFWHGSQKLKLKGPANEHGRLAALSIETPASSFSEAETIAFGAASPFLSAMAFEHDVPLRFAQMDVTQMSTNVRSMTYTCPYSDMVPQGTGHNNVPYVQSLLSLYREGINSNSPNYQFLCWYKIVEGINVKRAGEPAAQKKLLVLEFPERLEKAKVEQRKRLEEIFPFIRAFGVPDSRWDDIVPDDVLDWKFNRIREKKLEPLRNKIAHMISEPSGDLGLSPDSRETATEVSKWISLLRFIARVMITNEKSRIPPPAVIQR